MKYPINRANGDAGEFFFAYQIASVLKWPCRLLDIDIGIDAQVEIISDDRTSTGRFVAFQVKATSAEEQNCRYVSANQLSYWSELDLPVFVVLVDLSQSEMFLHQVDVNHKYPITKNGTVRIDFDLQNDRFGEASAEVISKAADEVAFSHVRKRLKSITKKALEIRKLIAAQEDNPDPPTLIEVMEERNLIRLELAQANALVSTLRVGAKEYSKVKADIENAWEKLRDFMEARNMHQTWDEDGTIRRFLGERR